MSARKKLYGLFAAAALFTSAWGGYRYFFPYYPAYTEWRTLSRLGHKQFSDLKYAEALDTYTRALDLAKQLDLRLVINSVDWIAASNRGLGKPEVALQNANRAV